VQSLQYRGADRARAAVPALELLASKDLDAVIFCPSNPWLSIAPMLAMPELRAALQQCSAPVVAVSPIVGGAAIKGPTAKIMAELSLPVSAHSVAGYYHGLLDGFVLDHVDRSQAESLNIAAHCAATVMKTDADKRQLADEVLRFAARLRK
jgi:LPPG:FO 2-phospho-L-lactate transferase